MFGVWYSFLILNRCPSGHLNPACPQSAIFWVYKGFPLGPHVLFVDYDVRYNVGFFDISVHSAKI